MILWKQYLAMLADDGVHMNEIDSGLVDEAGQPIAIQFLTKHLDNGTILSYTLPHRVESGDRVLWYMNRQIVNQLRLPIAKYVHPRSKFTG